MTLTDHVLVRNPEQPDHETQTLGATAVAAPTVSPLGPPAATPSHPADAPSDPQRQPLRVLSVTNMYPTQQWPAFGTFVFNEVQALRQAGVHVDVLMINGRASTWNYLRGLFDYWRVLRRRHYDLVHAHYVLTGVIARLQWGTPVVLTHHGPEVIGFPRWQTVLAKVVTPFFDQVIYRTEEMRRALKDRNGWIITAGLDLERFAPIPQEEARLRLGLPLDKRLVLWAGEFWRPEKCFGLAQAAVERVQAELDDVEMVVLSKKPQEIVPLYMSACDALVLTSSHEGSPNVIKEAMACNLPIVSVRVGDVPEMIAGADNCTLAERDPADLARKLLAVLSPPRRSNGRTRVEGLTHARITDRIVQVYTAAVERRRAGRAKN
jgi:teichuronic acid biosynthesis glycosyltransferase TuaC